MLTPPLLSYAILAQATPAAPDLVPVASQSLLDYIARGGVIGYVIIALSLVGLGLIIAQFIVLRKTALIPEGHAEMLDQMLRSGRVGDAITYCRAEENASFITRVVGSGLDRCTRSSFGFLELRTALEEAGQREVARLHRGTEAIGLIAAVAPMLGLLGTVVGMVGAFETISATEGTARPGQLAGSISVALITTVQGLIVAIPCTAAFSFLRGRIDVLASQAGEIVDALASHIEKAGGSDPSRTPAKPPAPGARPQPPLAARESRTA